MTFRIQRRGQMSSLRAILLVAFACLAVTTSARADQGDRIEFREWGIRAGGGINPSSMIEYYAVHPYVGLSLWEPASRWFEKYGMHALWMIEPWAAFVNDDHGKYTTSSFELGVSPLFARLVLGDAAFRPFLEGGEGIVYTDLRKQDLGTRIQFTSQVGAGLEYDVTAEMAVGFQIRFRHMSNAGMGGSNPGVNTFYGLLGVSFR
jgi:opacity protein-like surface antigen